MMLLIILLSAVCSLIFGYLIAQVLIPKCQAKMDAHIIRTSFILTKQLFDIQREKIEIAVYFSLSIFVMLGLLIVPTLGLKFLTMPVFVWIGWKAPLWAANYLLKRRIDKFEAQFVDGLTMVANAIKAGLSLQQAFEMASHECPKPFGEELSNVLAEIKIGRTMEDALYGMVGRIGTDDVNIVVRSICILKETGGNMIETFQTITSTVRERQKVHGKVRVLTTQGVVQGVIIFCMPFALAMGLYLLAPDFIMPLLAKPLGWVMILAALILQVVGALLMKKIVMIKI